MLFTEFSVADSVLLAHTSVLGDDFTGYRNHVYRVVNLCVALSPVAAAQPEKVQIAAVFHDLGIWTDRTFDYLEPSVRLADAYLGETGRGSWTAEVTTMIREHHKLRPYRFESSALAEPFRQADWIDVTRGILTFGLPRGRLAPIFSTWPSAGFHARLVRLELAHLRAHPRNPLPMMRW
jgi:hypothetical protein